MERETLNSWGIRVDEIPPEGICVNFSEVSGLSKELKVITPFSGYLKLKKRGIEVWVEGSLKGSLELICDLCLEAFEFKIEENFQITLIPKESLNFAEERELSAKELELSFYENSYIDYLKILEEEIFLNLPFRNQCKEDCKGICPSCGTNLNKASCDCSKPKRQSPFAVLKTINLSSVKSMEKGV